MWPWERLPHNAQVALAALFGLLTVATLVVAALRRAKPQSDWSELTARIRSWWIMVSVFTLAMVLTRTISLVFFGLISFLALKEYLSLIPTRRADRRVLFWAYLAIPIQYAFVAHAWYGMFIVFIPVYVFLFLPWRMVRVGQTDGFLKAAGTLHWGVMVTVFSISHCAYLLVLDSEPSAPQLPAGPAGLVLYLVALTQLNDVAQFLWGKAIGGPKVVPTVSPGKTWAGFLGGLFTTTVLAVLLAKWLTPLVGGPPAGIPIPAWLAPVAGFWKAAVCGLLIGYGGFIGDVTISAVKRDLHIKDSGSLLPGHGGLLDRIDSLTYTAPLFFHFTYYFCF